MSTIDVEAANAQAKLLRAEAAAAKAETADQEAESRYLRAEAMKLNAEIRKKQSEQQEKDRFSEAAAVKDIIIKRWFDRHRYIEAVGWMHLPAGESIWRLERAGNSMRDEIRLAYDEQGIIRASQVSGIMRMASDSAEFRKDADKFDGDGELVGLPNGNVLNLRTGEQRKADGKDLVTKRLGANPEAGKPTRFLRFLLEILPCADTVRYLQRAAGYMMTGEHSEQRYWFLFGEGGNGKSVLLDVLRQALGEYHKVVDADAMLSEREQHTTWLAELRGARLVTNDDAPKTPWVTHRLKALVTGGEISARLMRQDAQTFKARCKVVIAGNHKPVYKHEPGLAELRRIRFLDFPNTFTEESGDAGLAKKLAAEMPQIVNWMAQGAKAYLAEGLLPEPEGMRETWGRYANSIQVKPPLRRWAKAMRYSDALQTPTSDLLAVAKQMKIAMKRISGEALRELVLAGKEHGVFVKLKVVKIDGKAVRCAIGVGAPMIGATPPKQREKAKEEGQVVDFPTNDGHWTDKF